MLQVSMLQSVTRKGPIWHFFVLMLNTLICMLICTTKRDNSKLFFFKIQQVISRTTQPILCWFVLIWMYFLMLNMIKKNEFLRYLEILQKFGLVLCTWHQCRVGYDRDVIFQEISWFCEILVKFLVFRKFCPAHRNGKVSSFRKFPSISGNFDHTESHLCFK